MRETRLSGSEGGGTKPIVSSYPYIRRQSRDLNYLMIPLPSLILTILFAGTLFRTSRSPLGQRISIESTFLFWPNPKCRR